MLALILLDMVKGGGGITKRGGGGTAAYGASAGCEIRIVHHVPLGQYIMKSHWPDIVFPGGNHIVVKTHKCIYIYIYIYMYSLVYFNTGI